MPAHLQRFRVRRAHLRLAPVLLAVLAVPVTALPEASPAEHRMFQAFRSLRDPAARPEALVEEVARAAKEHPTRLMRILRERQIPSTGDVPRQRLSEVQEAFAWTVLQRLGRAWTRGVLDEWRHGDAEGRRVELDVLGAVGDRRDLLELIHGVLAAGEAEPRRELLDAFERALPRILERDPTSFAILHQSWRTLRPELVEPVLRGLGSTRDPRGIETLVDVLRTHPKHASSVMTQVSRIGRSHHQELDIQLKKLLRPYLSDEHVLRRQAACLALGRLGDQESFERLLELLEDDRRGVRHNAHWALKELTGLRLGPSPALWRDWREAEERWAREVRPRVLTELRLRQTGRVVTALHDLMHRRFSAEDNAEAITLALRHDEAGVRSLACRVLGESGARRGIPALIDRLEDPTPGVRAAAEAALVQLTGGEQHEDPIAWTRALLEIGS